MPPPPARDPKPVAVTFVDNDLPKNRAEIRNEQQTRRSTARNALDALRQRQIPGYDANIDDAERDVVIDGDLFRSLREDSAVEYQDANKPPWAPRVPAAILDKIRTWEVMETLTELNARQNPWYYLAFKVAGQLGFSDLDTIMVLGPRTASTDAVRPTRGQLALPPPISAGTTMGIGLTGIGPGLAGLTSATPSRPAFGSEAPTPDVLDATFQRFLQRRIRGMELGRRPAARPPVGGGGIDDDKDDETEELPPPPTNPDRRPSPVPPVVAGGSATAGGLRLPDPQPGEVPLAALTDSRIDADLTLQTLLVLGATELVQTGARYKELRDAARQPTAWYESDPSAEARAKNAEIRGEGARARLWATRPAATGVYYFSPLYVQARDEAYTQIVSRADQLANVEMKYFARNGRSDTVQFRVFTLFVRLIANHYRLPRHMSSLNAKQASDAANIASQIENDTKFFQYRISFNDVDKTFVDTGAAGALNRQPAWRGASFTHAPLEGEFADARTNPLLVRRDWPRSLDPAYEPGTILNPVFRT